MLHGPPQINLVCSENVLRVTSLPNTSLTFHCDIILWIGFLVSGSSALHFMKLHIYMSLGRSRRHCWGGEELHSTVHRL